VPSEINKVRLDRPRPFLSIPRFVGYFAIKEYNPGGAYHKAILQKL